MIKKPNTNIDFDIKKIYSTFKLPINIIIGLIALAILKGMFTFEVSEYQHAVVYRLGKVEKVYVSNLNEDLEKKIKSHEKFKDSIVSGSKGLKIKIPFIDSVKIYDSRLLTYDTASREITTFDKKTLVVDNNAQWKIINPALYSLKFTNIKEANTRLDDIMFSKVNQRVSLMELHSIIAEKTKVTEMLSQADEDINKSVEEFGMTVPDIQIKKAIYPTQNINSVFARMQAERQQKANQYKAEGEEEYTKIKAETDKQYKILVSDSDREAKTIKAQAESDAAQIYNTAYSKDPEFYQFYKSLEAYKTTINDKTVITIDKDSPFAKYFYNK